MINKSKLSSYKISEGELNQELSTDDLKDVAGESWTIPGNVSKKGNPQ